MMWYWGGGMHWWGWLSGALGMVVFWALIIWGAMALARWARDTRQTPHEEDPERILARRFAAGEIDAEEYRRDLHTLHGAQPASTGDR